MIKNDNDIELNDIVSIISLKKNYTCVFLFLE